MYNLYLDDERFPGDSFFYTGNPIYNKAKWDIVRSYNEFVSCITQNGMPNTISFDHDLADIHYETPINGVIDYSKYTEKTGYHCAQWLIDYCIDNNLTPPNYLVHSQNTVGGRNIKSLIENYKKFLERQ